MAKTLAQLFHFTADDLEQNRAGKLSDAQRQLFRPSLTGRVLDFGCEVLPLMGCIMLCPLSILPTLVGGYADNPSPQGAVAVVLCVVSIIMAIGLVLYVSGVVLRTSRIYNQAKDHDLDSGEVLAATVQLLYDEVGEHLYAVDLQAGIWLYDDGFAELDPKLQYRVYFTPESQLVLSVEPTDQPAEYDIEHLLTLSNGGRKPLPPEWERLIPR